jgi:Spy/CpxP family protein refolding chaperone
VNNWKVIFATVVIFGAGVITGGLLVNYVQHSNQKPQRPKAVAPIAANTVRTVTTNQPPPVAETNKLRPPEILSKQFLQQLDDSLHLKTEQREAIQKIIGEGQNQIRKVVQDSRLEIREVLTPEQRKQFDELVKRPFRKPIYGTNGTATTSSPTNTPAVSTNAP